MNFFLQLAAISAILMAVFSTDLEDKTARPVVPVTGNDNGWSIFMICEARNNVFSSALFRGSSSRDYRINYDCLRTTLAATSFGISQNNHANKWPVNGESFPSLFSYFEYQFACQAGDRVHVQRRINNGAWITIYSCDMNFDAHAVVFRPTVNPTITSQFNNEKSA